jgi:hypothetical protein
LSERRLFEANRLTIVLDHLKQGKRCFLEQPEWKTIPWALEPASKTALSHLEDILCDIPGLKYDAISIQNPELEPAQRILSHQALSRNILDHLSKLYAWRTRWDRDNPDACVEVFGLRPLNEHGLFPTKLYFTNSTLAYELIFYNAVLLILLQLGSGIKCPMFKIPSLPSTEPRGPLYLAGEAPNTLAVATEICKIAGYFLPLLPASQERVTVSLLFPLRVAYLVFPPAGKESEWLRGAMERVADQGGFDVSSYVSGEEPAADGEDGE